MPDLNSNSLFKFPPLRPVAAGQRGRPGLRLWHVTKDLHQLVDQLRKELNHRQAVGERPFRKVPYGGA